MNLTPFQLRVLRIMSSAPADNQRWLPVDLAHRVWADKPSMMQTGRNGVRAPFAGAGISRHLYKLQKLGLVGRRFIEGSRYRHEFHLTQAGYKAAQVSSDAAKEKL